MSASAPAIVGYSRSERDGHDPCYPLRGCARQRRHFDECRNVARDSCEPTEEEDSRDEKEMTVPWRRSVIALTLALGLTAGAAPAGRAAALDPPEMLAQAGSAVVTIRTEKSYGSTQGSGFIVDP